MALWYKRLSHHLHCWHLIGHQLSLAAPLLLHLPAKTLGNKQEIFQVLGPLPLTCEPRKELLVSICSLTQSQMSRALGKWTKGWKISLPLPSSSLALPLLLFLIPFCVTTSSKHIKFIYFYWKHRIIESRDMEGSSVFWFSFQMPSMVRAGLV